MDHAIFKRLKSMIEEPSSSPEWYAMAEQAINTIYSLGEHPDTLCAEIIRNKTVEVFGIGESSNDTPMLESDGDVVTEDAMQLEYDVSVAQVALSPQSAVYTDSVKLSQLCSILGHVAIKHIVHLEIIEAAWKRKKRKADGTCTIAAAL
jgi:condensin complex subunit 1